MNIRAFLLQRIAQFVFERPARRLSLTQMHEQLRVGGDALGQAIRQATDTPTHRRVVTHIIGIERWGQARMHHALTNTPSAEEYDAYRPADADLSQLTTLMHQTRIDTLALVTQLVETGVDVTRTVPHNTFGMMTLAGWLQYLHVHSTLEGRKLRK